MPYKITINDEQINLRLTRLALKANNLKPVFDQFGRYLLDRIRGYFRTETSPDGTPWAPLSPRYKARKRREGRDRGIGRYTLAMVNGLAYNANGRRLRVGTTPDYAVPFQFGAPRRNQPARPFLGVTDADRAQLSDLIGDYLGE